MSSSDAEILAQIHKVQADLFLALPSDIRMDAGDVTAAQIRIRLLRARLEFSPEQEHIPLPLVRLLALLFELTGHSDELSGLMDGDVHLGGVPANDVRSPSSIPTRGALLEAMRSALLTGDVTTLHDVLARQRIAFASVALQPPPAASHSGSEDVPPI